MIRKLPVVPTVIVLAAVATMIALGVWQLGRGRQKDALLAQYGAAQGLPPVAWPAGPIREEQLPLFRQASGMCLEPVATKLIAGRNREGVSGFSHLVDCRAGAEGPGMRVDIGWSRDPKSGVPWRGGPVSGVVASDGEMRMRLVSAEGLGGLEPSAKPNVADVPNNHRSYAVQWFLFAAAALVIYLLAVRGKLQGAAE
ncbi:SURF1 family protein [uncultured Sphingomonas sp.]|uniref:SURF1 family protein n=1 Tax=uncultured Sphingomonas sp. TaxID=158754 RepID=UPI0025FFACD8|nr:SURF1 family protein [uncultured Sphingomonas sp.]